MKKAIWLCVGAICILMLFVAKSHSEMIPIINKIHPEHGYKEHEQMKLPGFWLPW